MNKQGRGNSSEVTSFVPLRPGDEILIQQVRTLTVASVGELV